MFKIIGINYLTYQLKYHIYSNEVMFSLRALCKQGLIAHCTRILSGLLIIIDNCAIDLSVYLSGSQTIQFGEQPSKLRMCAWVLMR